MADNLDESSAVLPPGTSNATSSIPKCVCGWKNCRAYQKVFRDGKHTVWDGVIKLKFATDHPESMALKQSIDRTLRVPKPKQEEWKPGKRAEQQVIRYHVARHHWTEKHVQKYLGDPKTYSFLKPFSVHGAKKYLFTLDPQETYTPPGMEKATNENDVLYLQCPNVPKEVVKAEFNRVKDAIQNGTVAATPAPTSNTSPQLVTESLPAYQSMTNANPKKANDAHNNNSERRTVVSTISETSPIQEGDENDDDDDERANASNRAHAKQATNRTSNTVPKKDSMTASLTSHSRSNHGNGSVKLEEENKNLKEQLDAMKSQLTFLHDMVRRLQEEHFDHVSVSARSKRSDRVRSYHSHSHIAGGHNSSRSNRSGVPKEIEMSLAQGGESTTSAWNETAEDWTEPYEEDQADVAEISGHARTRGPVGSRGGIRSNGAAARGSSALVMEPEVDDDELTFRTTASRAVSIVSASKSIRSLKREQELDDDEDDSDTHESLEDAFDGRSYASTVKESQHSRVEDNSKRGGRPGNPPNNLRKPHRQHSGGSVRSTSRRGGDNPDASSHSHGDGNSSIGNNPSGNAASGGTYQVHSMTVTDPYGEKGTYTGSISNATGMPHGYGRLEYDRAGRWYEGDWKHGRWTGKGRLSNGDGDFYEGGLKNDHKHGWGIMKFADGRTFEGEYVNGQMIEGKMTYQDGSTYSGSWVDGMRHGRGRCVFTDKSVYEGEFREGEFFGNGRMTWSDGGHYVGEWWNGEMHGRGREVRPDGSLRHDGEWSKGQPIRNK